MGFWKFRAECRSFPCSYAQVLCFKISASLTQRRSSICFHSFLDAMPPVGRTRMQRLCVLIRLSTVHSGATLTGHILAPLFRGSAKHLVGVESMMERGPALGQLLVKQVPICCTSVQPCSCASVKSRREMLSEMLAALHTLRQCGSAASIVM